MGISIGTGDYSLPAACSRLTSDESVEISWQKVLAAGEPAMPDSASILLLFAAAAVIVAFVGYVMFRYRYFDRPYWR